MPIFGDEGLVSSAAFSPTDIANLTLWVKANAITGLNDGDDVTTWSDQSGNNNDLTSAVNKPVYKTNIVNSLPIVRFTAANSDNLLNANSINLIAGSTVFIVSAMLNAASNNGVISKQTNDLLLAQWGAIGVSTHKSGIEVIVSEGAQGTTNWEDTIFTCDGVQTFKIYRNNSLLNTNAAYSVAGLTNNTNLILAQDGGFFFSFDIAEVVLYTALLSDENRGKVHTYLADKYNL